MKKLLVTGAALAVTLGAAASAHAAVVSLNFVGLNGTNGNNEQVLNYYNGGTGSQGSGPGPNYGISFGSGAIVCYGAPHANACNSAMIPPPGGNLIFFLSPTTADLMDVAAGFTTGFSFWYSAVNNPGVVNVWSGLDGTGTLLATLNLPTTPNGAGVPGCYGTNFCPYSEVGVTFAGTAMSVDFGGTANQIAFADITLGSSTAPTPEPATWALMLVGLGGLGAAMRMRQRKASVAA